MTAALRALPSALREYARVPGWSRQLMALGALCASILTLYAHDALDMARIWWTSSTYGHCIFIPLLIGWLVHQRVAGLRRLEPVSWPLGLLWLGAGALCWLLGDAAGLAVLRHGGLVVMLQGAVAASLGPAVTRALLFPLFYSLFMVPLGSELEPALQLLTAKIAMALLGAIGVPAHIEGIFITTPTGYFKVAEACSGAKFVVAMAAYGVLVCNVCFRSWVRRIVFLVSALVVCILANGVRAFATIIVAHRTGIEAAKGFDHVVWGWLFFAVVMIAVMVAAWPFFDRKPGEQGFDAERLRALHIMPRPAGGVVATALVLAIAAPAWSHISALRGEADLAPPSLPSVPGWSRSYAPMAYPWKPRFEGADYFQQARYADARGHVVDLAIASYARQSEGRELIGFGQGAVDPESEWAWSDDASSPDMARAEIITAPGPVERKVLSWYRVGNAPLRGADSRVKFDTMKARLLMQDQRAVVVLFSIENPRAKDSDEALGAFRKSLGPIEELADAAARTR